MLGVLKRLFGIILVLATAIAIGAVKVEDGKVVFTFTWKDAQTVHLAGTFNNWSTTANPMIREGDTWKAVLELKPGTYQYKYVINGGKMWKEDPEAPGYTDDGFGGKNGVFTLALRDGKLVILAPAPKLEGKLEVNPDRIENIYVEDNTYIVIKYYNPKARYVFIAGNFNDWSTNTHECYSSGEGWWEAVLELTPGIYQYKFIVDGKEWVVDPNAPAYVDDGFGGKNGVFEVYKESGILKVRVPHVEVQEEEKTTVADVKEKNIGAVEYEIDGKLSEKEKTAASFVGNDILKEVYIARTSTAAYVAISLDKPARDYINQNVLIEVYANAPRMLTPNRSTFSKTVLPKEVAYRFSINMRTWQARKRGSFFASAGDDSWLLQANVFRSAVDDVVEMEVPYDILGIKSGDEFNVFVVVSVEGKDVAIVPSEGLITIKAPTLISGNVIAKFSDKVGDDYGFGTYTYPKDPAFAPYKGLWDIVEVTVLENDEAYVFSIRFAEMTNPWGAPKGFSHQLINIYLDTKPGGRTDTYKEGARVEFKEPWDYFIKIAGWPDYGQVFATSDGKEIPDAISYEADVGDKTIHVIVRKKYLEVKSGVNVYILSMSQDGYGTDHIRPVTVSASQWTLGGYPADSKDYAPFVLDIIVPEGYTQEEILKSYIPGTKYATLIPVKIK